MSPIIAAILGCPRVLSAEQTAEADGKNTLNVTLDEKKSLLLMAVETMHEVGETKI